MATKVRNSPQISGFSDEFELSGRSQFDDGRGEGLGVIVLAILHHIVYAAYNGFINIGVIFRSGLTGEVGGGGNNGFPETADQLLAKIIFPDAKADRAT